MALARFKELCMDTTGGEELGRFWAGAVGATFRTAGETGDVVGAQEYQCIAMCGVPEAKSVKHRVHLDVYGDPGNLESRGATVVRPAEESGLGWTVMQDPEGGEFCAFPSPQGGPLPPYRLHGLVVDSADPEAAARWWSRVYGVPALPQRDGEWWALEHTTPDPVLTMDFVAVPEPKTVKNRIHWDVYGDVAPLLDHGARVLWEMPRWTVLADPEGNEFCVFPDRDGA
jgi:Glyoxalase-like domain